jgi:tetratricopeptide (TPR) repeat protein
MERNIDEIYDLIYNDNSTKESKNFIRIVEPHMEIIEQNYSNIDYDKYFKSTRLLSDYSIQLVNDGYLKKALPYLEKSIQRFENDIKLKGKNIFEKPMYEALIWNRGMINFNLQKKKKAQIDFLKLIENFPENDKYNNWLKACSDRKYGIAEWTFASVAIISIFFSFILDPSDGIFDKVAIFGIIIGIFGGLTVSYIRKKRLKMK